MPETPKPNEPYRLQVSQRSWHTYKHPKYITLGAVGYNCTPAVYFGLIKQRQFLIIIIRYFMSFIKSVLQFVYIHIQRDINYF